MKISSTNISYLNIHLSVLLFGFAGLFGKLISQPAQIIVLGRVVFASLFLLFYIRFSKRSLKLGLVKNYLLVILQGGILAFHWFAFFRSIQLSSVAIGLLSFSTFPVFTVLLEPLFVKTRFRKRYLLISIITIIGVYFIIPNNLSLTGDFLGLIWGILSGLSFAMLSIINRIMVQKISSLILSFYQDIFASLFLLPFFIISTPVLSSMDIVYMIVLGIFFTALAHNLFIYGLKKVKAQTASIIATLEPVYGILFASILLHEFPGIKVVIGGLIIISCAVFISFDHNKYG